MNASSVTAILLVASLCAADTTAPPEPPEGRHFKPFVWPSRPPADCPFESSTDIVGVAFLGIHSDYRVADTWYPSWASDGLESSRLTCWAALASAR